MVLDEKTQVYPLHQVSMHANLDEYAINRISIILNLNVKMALETTRSAFLNPVSVCIQTQVSLPNKPD